MSVSIIGVGLHPFGRFDISGRQMGLIAARAALADAGLQWSDVGFAAGGSRDGGHADALVSELGLTGSPFMMCTTDAPQAAAPCWPPNTPSNREPPTSPWLLDSTNTTGVHLHRTPRSMASMTGTAKPA